MRRLSELVLTVVLGVVVSGCTSSDDQPKSASEGEGTSAGPSVSAGTSPSQTPAETPTETIDGLPVAPQPGSTLEETNAANEQACVDDDTQTVEMLDPVVVEDVRVEPTTYEAVEDTGERIEEVTVPGFVISGYTFNPGCVIHQEAPPGCAGGVTITGFEIPGVRIPDVTLPERTLPDGSVQAAETIPGDESEGVVVPPETVDPVCQVEARDAKLAATRAALSRKAASRTAISRTAASQTAQSVTVEGKDDTFYAPSRYLTSVYVPSVYVPSSYAPSEYLPYEALETEPEVDVAQGDDARAYVAPSKVLFDENKAVLKPAAQKALRAIVNDINKQTPNGQIAVDGYTDNQGSAESGLTLSKARADAVAQWLTTKGGVPTSRIAAIHGYGEKNPAAPNNNEANMAKNRRVVISVSDG